MKDLETLVNSRQWPQGFRAELDKTRMTAFEYIKQQIVSGPMEEKSIEAISQEELIAEITSLASPERVARLPYSTMQEAAEGCAKQWKRKRMTESARKLHNDVLRDLRKMKAEEK